MDKTSGVTPIAAGAIKGRIGRLTSAAALRVTMLALLAKTEQQAHDLRRRRSRGCASCRWRGSTAPGLFHTTRRRAPRRDQLAQPACPQNEIEQLEEAEAKRELGVPEEIVLRELGY